MSDEDKLKTLLVDLAKNKEELMHEVIENIDQSIIIETGMLKFIELIENEYSEIKSDELETLFKMTKTISRSLSRQALINIRMLSMFLIYISGDSYASDVNKMLIKLGEKDDEIKEAFKNNIKERLKDE